MDRVGPVPTVNQVAVESLTGAVVTTNYGGKFTGRYSAVWDLRTTGGVSGPGLRRKLTAFVNHVQRGGGFLLAEDSAYAFAAFATTLPTKTATKINIGTNIFESLAPGVSVNGREIWVQSDPGTYYHELKLCSAHAVLGNNLDVAVDVAFPYSTDAAWVLVRDAGAWPALRVPIGERNGEILKHRHETVFELDLPWEEDPEGLAALQGTTPGGTSYDTGTLPPPDTTGSGGVKPPPVLDSSGPGGGPPSFPSRGGWIY